MLNAALTNCLRTWLKDLKSDNVRPMLIDTADLPLHITITDGEGTGWLGLLYLRPRDPSWKAQAAQVQLPETWRATWQTDKKTDINEVEAASAPVALATWPQLTDGMWIHFVDNTSAQSTLTRGCSSVTSLNSIARHVWQKCAERRLLLWADRVSTRDNPTDGLSRQRAETHGEQWHMVPATIPEL